MDNLGSRSRIELSRKARPGFFSLRRESRLDQKSRGASLVEYAMIVGLLSVIVVVSVNMVGDGVGRLLEAIGKDLQKATVASAQVSGECQGGHVLTGLDGQRLLCRSLTEVLSASAGRCVEDEILKMDGTGVWRCAPDQTAGLVGAITAILSGSEPQLTANSNDGVATLTLSPDLADGDQQGVTSVLAGQGITVTNGSTDSPTVELSACAAGEGLRATGPGIWSCAPFSSTVIGVTGVGDAVTIVDPLGPIVGLRLTGDCGDGYQLRGFNEDGDRICEADGDAAGSPTSVVSASSPALAASTTGGVTTLTLSPDLADGDQQGVTSVLAGSGIVVENGVAANPTVRLPGCGVGQELRVNAAGDWQCLAGSGITGLYDSGNTIVITDPAGPTVGLRLDGDCGVGNQLRGFDQFGQRICVPDATGGAGTIATVQTAGNSLTVTNPSGPTATLRPSGDCGTGNQLRGYDTSGNRICVPDAAGLSAVDESKGIRIFDSGGVSRISMVTCPEGQVLRAQAGGNWNCSNGGDVQLITETGDGMVITDNGTDVDLRLNGDCGAGRVLQGYNASGARICVDTGASAQDGFVFSEHERTSTGDTTIGSAPKFCALSQVTVDTHCRVRWSGTAWILSQFSSPGTCRALCMRLH